MKLKLILIFLAAAFNVLTISSTKALGLEVHEKLIITQNFKEDDDFDDFADFSFDVSPEGEVYDPLESVNRKIFIFNDYVDRYFFQHVAIFYRDSLPQNIRKSVRNFFNNLSAPFSAVNSLLQGNPGNAMASFSSFLINSTLGLGGILDIAGNKEVRYYEEDLGQTFAVYGVNPGPYLVLPFIGPSNFRDGAGLGIESATSPLSANLFKVGGDELFKEEILYGMTSISLIDKRESLLKIIDDLRNNSFDPYATARSAYMQNRHSKIINENKL